MSQAPSARYWNNEAADAFPLLLTVEGEERLELRVGSNRGAKAPLPVGLFRAQLKRKKTADLLAALRAPDFAALPGPMGLLSGEAIYRLALMEEGKPELMRWFGQRIQHPPAFLRAEQEALKLVALAREAPVQAVVLEWTLAPTVHQRGERALLTVTLANVGADPIRIPGPKGYDKFRVVWMLQGDRTDIPPTQFLPHHQKFEELQAADIVEFAAEGRNDPTVLIPKGGRVRIGIRRLLDWPPGKYALMLTCQMPLLDAAGQKLMNCELVLPERPFACSGPPKPTDEPSDQEPAPEPDEPDDED